MLTATPFTARLCRTWKQATTPARMAIALQIKSKDGGGDSGNVEGGGSGPHGGHSSVGANRAHGGAGASAGGGSSGGATSAHGGIGTSAGGGSSGGGANAGTSAGASSMGGGGGGSFGSVAGHGGGGPDQGGSPSHIFNLHHGALGLLKKYLTKYLSTRLKAEPNVYVSVPFSAAGVATASSKLRVLSSGIAGSDTRAMASKSLHKMFFCRLVRHRPSRLLYHHVKGQEGFAPSDSIVTVHKVMKVGFTERSVLVDIASCRYGAHATTQNMVLSLPAFPVEALVRLRFWD